MVHVNAGFIFRDRDMDHRQHVMLLTLDFCSFKDGEALVVRREGLMRVCPLAPGAPLDRSQLLAVLAPSFVAGGGDRRG